MKGLSVVIPVYNEATIVRRRVRQLVRGLAKLNTEPCEIILVENGSRDNTRQLIGQLAATLPAIRLETLAHPSYGGALRAGILATRYETVAIMNLDFWDLDFLGRGQALLAQCHIVNGSKTLAASRDRRPLHRRLVTYWFNVLLRLLFNFPGTDTHGIKVFRRTPVLPIVRHCRTVHELFDTELVLRACHRGLVLAELPITLKEIRPSRYHNWQRLTNTLFDVVRLLAYNRGK